WTQEFYLKAGNTGASDFFGGAVAISSDSVVVGAIGEDRSTTGVNAVSNEGASDAGAAYTFSLPNPTLEYPPGIRLSEGVTVDLGTVATGASSTLQTFTVRNVVTVHLTALTLSAEGLNAGDFALSAPTGTTAPAGGTVT